MTKSPKYPIALSDSEVLVKSKPFAEFETPPGLYHWKAAIRAYPQFKPRRQSSRQARRAAIRNGNY
jgi:hypothetical protein